MPQYTSRDGAARLYDGTGTPFYIELVFEDGNISHSLGQPEPEQRNVLNRGRFDEFWHMISGPDRPEPLNLSFSFKLATIQPNLSVLRQAMNLDLSATWTVGDNTWVTTKGTSQRLSGDPTRALVTTPAFASGRMRTVNFEYLLVDPSGSGVNTGYKLTEVQFNPDEQTLSEGEDGVTISCTGRVWGTVSRISAFTSGTAE